MKRKKKVRCGDVLPRRTFLSSGHSLRPVGSLFLPLERVDAGLAGADFDNGLHIVDKDLTVSNMARFVCYGNTRERLFDFSICTPFFRQSSDLPAFLISCIIQ